jgi:hypothetical protein
MKRITRKRHWRAEVLSSFERAAKLYDSGRTDLDDWRDLYKLAAGIAAQNRGITDRAVIESMETFSREVVALDHEIEPKNKDQVFFHFVIAYVQSHVPAEILGELEADRIMDYLNDNIDLFPAV